MPTSYLALGHASRALSNCVRQTDRAEQAFMLRQLAAELANSRPEFTGTPVYRYLTYLADIIPSSSDAELEPVRREFEAIAAAPAAGNLARSIAAAVGILLWTELGRPDLAANAYPHALELADAALADALRTYANDPKPYSILDAATGRAEDALCLGAELGTDLASAVSNCTAIDADFLAQWRNVQPLSAGDRPSKDQCEFVPRARPSDLDSVWHHLRLLMRPGEQMLWFAHSLERSTAATTERVVVFRKDQQRTRCDVRHDVPLWAIQDVTYRCDWVDFYVRFADSRTGSTVRLNFKADEWKAADICQRLRALTQAPALESARRPAESAMSPVESAILPVESAMSAAESARRPVESALLRAESAMSATRDF